jgi:mannosylglycerate hydrolase
LEVDPGLKCYTFDGQVAPIEDYLEVCPDDTEKLRSYIRDGRIEVGPFYVLADSFLVSGEGLIRNLLAGHEASTKLGGKSMVGYLPDMFGHASQMPQILKGFGIDSALLYRGMEARICKRSEFLWQGADGSELLAYHLAFGYWNLKSWGLLGESPAAQFGGLLSRLDERSATKCHLMINGSDHLYPQPEMSEYIAASAVAFPEIDIVNASLDAFVRELRARASTVRLETVKGELRYPRDAQINASVYSSRVDIKRENRRAENMLERFAEPLSAFASVLGARYPRELLAHAWKELIQNYPHDSICAASTDEVHKDVLARYHHSLDISGELFGIAAGRIADRISAVSTGSDDRLIVVFNPFAWTRKDSVTVSVDFPAALDARDFELIAPDGNKVEYELLGVEDAFALVEHKYTSKGKIAVRRFTILFIADLPPTGYAAYRAVPCALRDKRFYQQRQMLASMAESIENEFFVVTANRLTCSVTVKDKGSGRVWRGINALCDAGDCGDEYQYAAPFGNDFRYPVLESLSIERNAPPRSILRLHMLLHLPKSLSPDRHARAAEMVPCRVRTTVALYKGIERVDFETIVENDAEDHILYARFPSELCAGKDFAHSPFDIVHRNVDILEVEDGDNEIITPFKPMQSFAGISDGECGFAVANRGLYEYRTDREEEGTCLSLTLLRATGWLFKEVQASSRDGQPCTTPVIATPGSQLKGFCAFEYSFIPILSSLLEYNRHEAVYNFSVPLEAKVYPIAADGGLPQYLSFLDISNPLAVLSSVTATLDGDLLVRFYNISEGEIFTTVAASFPIAKAERCDMLNAPLADLDMDCGALRVVMRGKEIVTIKLQLGSTT